jgi:SpoVK/Ycf46/Vps4 family AAA+-type ATPase
VSNNLNDFFCCFSYISCIGADLENLCREAALECLRRDPSSLSAVITESHLLAALDLCRQSSSIHTRVTVIGECVE